MKLKFFKFLNIKNQVAINFKFLLKLKKIIYGRSFPDNNTKKQKSTNKVMIFEKIEIFKNYQK